MKRLIISLTVALVAVPLVGCGKSSSPADAPKVFSLAWSEYPSWSVFGVAHENGIIDGAEGKRGKVEEKWNIDIVLKQLDYDSCITAYGSGATDAVCITNMDILAPSQGRQAVAILPTSTSDGADACIVTGVDSVDELKGIKSYGLEKSVSQYLFVRALEEQGLDPADFPFSNMDPAAAATAMQTKQGDVKSIVVWNPFLMQTLRTREGEARVLFDSTAIPEEIIDMVVVADDALQRPGGQSFACAVVEAFYEVNRLMENPAKADDTLVALGQKFSNLGLEDMKTVVTQTKFYKNAAEGMALFAKPDFQNTTMPAVVDFCAANGIVDTKPSIAFGQGDAQLRFEPLYMGRLHEEAAHAEAFAKTQAENPGGDGDEDAE